MKTAKLIFSIFLLLLLEACATTEETLDGQALFISKSCSGCHGSDASGIVGNGIDIRGKTASRISYALNGDVSQMSGLPSLTSAEIDAIAEYLLSLSSSSKLSKTSAVINGVIQSDQDTSAIVVLKDNSGQAVELEIENGEFVFANAMLQFPVLLKYVDDEGNVLFGISNRQDQHVE
ncbi:MAG: cytochrome c, partial [Gammaproteobacteria bacterium]|nr:cytochrome c [Gammaproteobacteria bacterium]